MAFGTTNNKSLSINWSYYDKFIQSDANRTTLSNSASELPSNYSWHCIFQGRERRQRIKRFLRTSGKSIEEEATVLLMAEFRNWNDDNNLGGYLEYLYGHFHSSCESCLFTARLFCLSSGWKIIANLLSERLTPIPNKISENTCRNT